MTATDYLKLHDDEATRVGWYEKVRAMLKCDREHVPCSNTTWEWHIFMSLKKGGVFKWVPFDYASPCPASLAELVKERVREWDAPTRIHFAKCLDELIVAMGMDSEELLVASAIATPAQIASAALAASEKGE